MICEMTAEDLERDCPTYISLKAADMEHTFSLLRRKYERTEKHEQDIRIYDKVSPAEVVNYLYKNGVIISEISSQKIGLEEYYIDLMKEVRAKWKM